MSCFEPCPFPLVVPDDLTSTEGVVAACCAIPCTGTMLSQGDIDDYNSLLLGLSTISLLCGIFLVVTWGLFAVKERQKVTFWLGICGLFLTFPIWLGAVSTAGKSSDYWCKTNNEAVKQSDGGLCIYQGISLVYFALAACSWWFVSCVDLFNKLVLAKRNIEHYLTYYHIFSWSLPALSTIVLLGLEEFGYFAPRVWCFLAPGSMIPEWILYYTPLTIMWVIGTSLMVAVIVVLLRRIRQVEGGGSDPAKVFRYLVLYKQPLIFVFAMSFIWLIVVVLAFVILVEEDGIRESGESWIACLIGNTIAGILDPARNTSADTSVLIGAPSSSEGCGIIQPRALSKGLITLVTIVLSSVSTIIFLVFGLHRENFILWRDFICPRPVEPSSMAAYTTKLEEESMTSYTAETKKARQKHRPELSNRALIVIGFVTNTWEACTSNFLRLKGSEQPNAGLESLGQGEQYDEQKPRYKYNSGKQEEEKKYVKQDVDNLSYDDWEKQFLVDPLWGIN